jgi:hypothetical protein
MFSRPIHSSGSGTIIGTNLCAHRWSTSPNAAVRAFVLKPRVCRSHSRIALRLIVISNSVRLGSVLEPDPLPVRERPQELERVEPVPCEIETDGEDDVFVDGMILDIEDVLVERLAGAAGAEAVVADPGGQLAEILVDGAGELTSFGLPIDSGTKRLLFWFGNPFHRKRRWAASSSALV